MLDDLKYIHQRDKSDALGVAAKQWQQLTYDYGVAPVSAAGVANIIVAGMGGSALAASMLGSWPELDLPLEVSRDYQIPAYADDSALFVASSYSGNTEETLSALDQAESKGCRIVVIAAGGRLAERAEEKDYPLFRLPAGFQPRMAVFYNFAALIQLLEGAGIVSGKLAELAAASDWLKAKIDGWLPTVPAKDNPAKALALDIVGKSPVIYAGPKLFPAAYKWKISFNENAKNVAWCSQLPEFNHNEFLGWTSHPVDKPYAVIDLRSGLEHPRVQKRFEISERLLSGQRPAPLVVEVEGESLLEQLLWTVTLGDFVSLYLALLNGLDPTPVDLIEKLKAALKD